MNPVVISVLLMCVLCLLKFNVIISILLSALVAGIMSGMGLNQVMNVFVGGMSGSNQIALSYILLGALAFGVAETGLASRFVTILERLFGKSGKLFILVLAGIASLSQNLIPIHIAFIPILIPPLLRFMNKLNLDRRMAACALTFGLKAPYILIPIGFGDIFQNIVATNMTLNGMEVVAGDVWSAVLLPVAGMAIGLLVAIFVTYRKPRAYQDLPIVALQSDTNPDSDNREFGLPQWGALIGSVSAFVIQIVAHRFFGTGASPAWALPIGATVGVLIMLATGAIKYQRFDYTIKGGIQLMGFIAFVMLVASGFGAVIRETGGVATLIDSFVGVIGHSQLLGAIAMLAVGLFVTMGIGTSFGTVPIIATIFVPLGAALGFSPAAIIALIATAGAMGDAGSPASDSTLAPSAGLGADNQHDHIWDTCVPTFIHFDIPLFVFGVIAAMVL